MTHRPPSRCGTLGINTLPCRSKSLFILTSTDTRPFPTAHMHSIVLWLCCSYVARFGYYLSPLAPYSESYSRIKSNKSWSHLFLSASPQGKAAPHKYWQVAAIPVSPASDIASQIHKCTTCTFSAVLHNPDIPILLCSLANSAKALCEPSSLVLWWNQRQRYQSNVLSVPQVGA